MGRTSLLVRGAFLAATIALGVTAMEIQPQEHQAALELIRSHCRDGGWEGGFMLVYGPRGAGNSRLVDEALTFPEKSMSRQYLLESLCCSKSRSLRNKGRFPLKVELNPSFAESVEQSSPTTTVHVLRNVVFHLTNTLDPRLSRRNTGRTLRNKLGWYGYWFASNAPWRPGDKVRKALPLVAVLLLNLTIAFLVVSYWNTQIPANWLNGFVKGLSISLYFTVSTLASWIFLHWLDWRPLYRVSRQLYDLVHSQDFDLKEDHRSTQTLAIKQRWPLAAGIVLVFLVLGVEFVPDVLSVLGVTQTESVTTPSVNPFRITGAPGLITFLLGVGLLIHTRSRRAESHSVRSFGQKNPLWMTSLLGQYLSLMRECRIEPVLVFNDLNDMERQISCTDPGQANKDSGTDIPVSEKLEQFLVGLLQLRRSEITDFRTILVGGPRLYRVLNGALLRGDTGSSVCGDLSPNRLFLGSFRPLWNQDGFATPMQKQDEPLLNWMWVESRGLLSNFQRLRREWVDPGRVDLRPSAFLAERVNYLWEPENIENELLSRFFTTTQAADTRRSMLHDPWRILWMRMGMACMAWELTHLGERPLSLGRLLGDFARLVDEGQGSDQETPLEDAFHLVDSALASRNHRVLVALGRMLLVFYLRWYYDDASLNGMPREGIPPRGYARDDRIRLVLPDDRGNDRVDVL